ncbi:MAG: hypothetical protein AVDCRST_MAG01-01-2900, partial [uncultured Rubrobacteraceae bacterium]
EAHRPAQRRPLPRSGGLEKRRDHNHPLRRPRLRTGHDRSAEVRRRGRGGGGVVAHGPAAGDRLQGQARGETL